MWSTTPPAPIIKPGWTTDPTLPTPVITQEWAIKHVIRARMRTLSAQMVGEVRQNGTIASALQRALFAGAGAQHQYGDLAAALQAARFGGTDINPGVLAAQIRPAVAALSGEHGQAGTMTAALQPATVALAGQKIYTGALASALVQATAQLAGAQSQSGVLDADLTRALMAATGAQTQSGAIAAVLRRALFAGAGAQAQSGTLAGQLRYALAAMTGTKTVLPVAYDATGGGVAANDTTPSWNHNIAADATAIVVGLVSGHTSGSTITGSMNCGGVPMTQLGTVYVGSSNYLGVPTYLRVHLFGLLNPPTGNQTISGTVSGTGRYVTGNSVSYKNAASFGTVATNSGNSGSASVTATADPNGMVANVFGSLCNSGGFSSYNRTNRYSKNVSPAVYYAGLVGDAVAAGSFTASVTSARWSGIAVPVNPAT